MMFMPASYFVCLSVSQEDISQTELTSWKLVDRLTLGQGCLKLNFGVDPYLG